MIETDWPPFMPDVALALLGEPSRKASREWRYGRRGSLVVNLTAGTWKDYESGDGGGVLALIEREQSCNRAGAVQWAVSQGLLPENGTPPHRTPKAARMPQNRRTREGAAPAGPVTGTATTLSTPTAALAGEIWEASELATWTPAHDYLAGRMVWPPQGEGCPSLPPGVRWLDRAAGKALDKLREFPKDAAGVLVFAYRLPGGDLAAVELEALLTDGTRPDPRWRRTYGPRTGAAFEAAAGGRATVLCEGAVTALAARRLHQGCRVLACGGTSGLEAVAQHVQGRLVLEVDGDKAGRTAALELAKRLRQAGRDVTLEINPQGMDPADVWESIVGERSAIMEFDGGMTRTEAERAAWNEHLKGGPYE